MSWELSLLFKATVLLGVTLAAVGLFPRTRASRRHLILASGFAALVLLPVAAALVPAVAIPLPITGTPGAAMNEAPSIAGVETAPVSPRLSEGTQPIPASPAPPSLTTMLRGLWLFGAASILTVLAGSLWSLYRLQRSGLPWTAGQALAAAIAKEAGLNRKVAVIVHERTAVPATMGVLRPTILLPPDAPHWAEADLRRVLIHEIEHVRRGDWWIHLSARAVCIAYWFHPLVWIAWRQLGVEAERACDDAVVDRMDRADYADQLVALAARLSAPRPRLMLSIANRSDLAKRVGAILNPRQQRGRAGTVAAATIIGIVGLLMGTVASLQAVAGRHDPVGGRAVSGHPVASAADSPLDADQFAFQPESRLETAGVAARPARPQPTTPTTPLSRPESAELAAQDVSPSQPPSRTRDGATPYVIGPDDVLNIVLWRQEDLSREVVVRPDGKISLPLVGDIQAAGLTPDRLVQLLVGVFARFIQDPEVTVIVSRINSRRVFIVGAVVKPGVYQLTDSMTVLQLLATAGGLTDFARKDAIVIARRVDGKNVSLSFDYAAFVNGQQLEQNIMLLPGDTVVVR